MAYTVTSSVFLYVKQEKVMSIIVSWKNTWAGLDYISVTIYKDMVSKLAVTYTFDSVPWPGNQLQGWK